MAYFTRSSTHLQVGEGADAYVVALRDGHLPVRVYDQGCNPWDRGEQLIDPAALLERGDTPAWGQGWTVLDTAGTEHWFMSNWDSSG